MSQQSSVNINPHTVKMSAQTNVGIKEEEISIKGPTSTSQSSASGSLFSFSWGSIPGIGHYFASAHKDNQPHVQKQNDS